MEGEANQLLSSLGLTEYEAKTLNALFRLKETEAPEVSRVAQVPKTRVYDVLDKLTQKGLVIEIRGRPKKYRALDAEDVFGQLISERKKETAELEKKANALKSTMRFSNAEESSAERVMKVRDRNDFMRILAQEIDGAKEEVIAFTKLDDSHHLLKDSIHNASKKKVSVRMLGKVPAQLSEIADGYAKAGVDLREHEHGLNAFVIDKKKVILAISDLSKERPEYHFTIWNHKPMAAALESYFNECWKKGKEW